MTRHQKQRIKRLERALRSAHALVESLSHQINGLQRQVAHAARATNEMAAHSRAAEVALAAARLDARGIHVFGDPGSRLGGALVIEPLPQSTRELIESQPKQIDS